MERKSNVGTNPSARELCCFLAEYGAHLLGCGAACIRLDRNISRIAAAYGMTAEMTIMPHHVHLTVRRTTDSEMFTAIATVPGVPISFNVNTRLSQLSWAIADGRIGYPEAVESFKEIISSDRQPAALVLTLVPIANAAFCRLFGGDIAAMAVVALATLAGFWLKRVLTQRKSDVRAVVLLSSFISAMIGALAFAWPACTTPALAMGTSVLYLVPGIPFLNSFSDVLYRHYICAFGRLMDAIVLTACLSIGLCAAMLAMHVGMF